MTKSWKTTATGAVNVLLGVFLIYQGNTEVGIASIIAGLGLLSAKDGDVTGIGDTARTQGDIDETKEKKELRNR